MFNSFRLVFIILMVSGYLFSQDVEFIEPSEMKRGMTLTSKTRMSGNVMHEFKLVVLSVLKGQGQLGGEEQWIVMANIEDELIQKTGVLQGMSGSPVYYENKLLGAIAFTDGYQKIDKAIVFIRPIVAMMDMVSYSKVNKVITANNRLLFAENIKTPLMMSGNIFLSNEEINRFIGKKYNYIAGGMTSELREIKSGKNTFESGDAIAVQLVSGDLNMAAIGTVTYVKDDYVLAFGHPMMNLGKTKMPMHLAKVDAVMPKRTISYKIGSVGREVGSIVEDRNSGIMGKYGVITPKTPIKINLKTPNIQKNFDFEIIRDKHFISSFTPLLLFNSIVSYESVSERNMYVNYKIKLKLSDGLDDLEYSGTFGLPDLDLINQTVNAVTEIIKPIDELFRNPYQKIEIESMDIDLDVGYGDTAVKIVDIYLDKLIYLPGDEVVVKVEFEKYREKKKIKKTFKFNLSKNISEGEHFLMYNSGRSFYRQMYNLFDKDLININGVINKIVEKNDKWSNESLIFALYENEIDDEFVLKGKTIYNDNMPKIFQNHMGSRYEKSVSPPTVHQYSLGNTLIMSNFENSVANVLHFFVKK